MYLLIYIYWSNLPISGGSAEKYRIAENLIKTETQWNN